jgi:hypothetical protein
MIVLLTVIYVVHVFNIQKCKEEGKAYGLE